MPYSTYTRIRDLLYHVAAAQQKDYSDLAQIVHEEPVESFAIWRRGTAGNSVKQYCSPKAIRRLIRFMRALELVNIENNREISLTPKGQNALQGNNFNPQLSTQLKEYLEKNGANFATLIKTMKDVKLPEVPDRYTILEHLRAQGATIDDEKFRIVVNLFVRTGELSSRMRRMFTEARR